MLHDAASFLSSTCLFFLKARNPSKPKYSTRAMHSPTGGHCTPVSPLHPPWHHPTPIPSHLQQEVIFKKSSPQLQLCSKTRAVVQWVNNSGALPPDTAPRHKHSATAGWPGSQAGGAQGRMISVRCHWQPLESSEKGLWSGGGSPDPKHRGRGQSHCLRIASQVAHGGILALGPGDKGEARTRLCPPATVAPQARGQNPFNFLPKPQ